MLTRKERERYDRQILISEIGLAGQKKLKKSRVVIAGAGGLGSPIAIYLTAAGIGTIRVIDHDQVELSNLNRQILHGEKDIGKNKSDSAKRKLRTLNSTVEIEALTETITANNVSRLVDGCDIIVDAMDNLPTRYILNRCAIEKNIPFIHGAVSGFEGRVTTIIPGETACLKCIYRGTTAKKKVPVIGVTPAVIGSVQATEAIKCLTGIGALLTNRLLIYDGLKGTFLQLTVHKNPQCDHCGSQ
ncbi:MAG: HesA/MoeB/ThiF family protein [Deltaproteobacteria bacterium]|nr:HesA/MoeB/ThiF family protein [Deltaproteobacteria bacterium]